MLYRGLEWTDGWISLPGDLSKALIYRRNWQHYVSETALASSSRGALWIHGASVGELEDLASLFLDPDRLKELRYTPESCILTSSSPSAESRLLKWKKRHGYRYTGPLPPENAREIDQFLDLLNPEFLIINQNDLWPRLLERLRRRKSFKGIIWLPAGKRRLPRLLPALKETQLLGVSYRSSSDRDRWQSEFRNSQVDIRVMGNPRIDRILGRIAEAKDDPDGHILADFGAEPQSAKISILLGSVWKEDAHVWRQALDLLSDDERAQLQLVALPHDSENLHEVASIRQLIPEARVLALQGVLLEAYHGYSVAYIGGAFGRGLHNVLEALLWRIPVICGPRIENQGDARRLILDGAVKEVSEARDLQRLLSTILRDKSALDSWRDKASQEANHLEDSRGAIQRLLEQVRDLRGK